MVDSATLAQECSAGTPRKSYQRMEGEPALWWRRFVLYRDLGYKRSLQAAFEQERASIRVLKSTKDIVPGSWKAASIKWRWVERARAYDEHQIDYVVEENLAEILDGVAQPIFRVKALKSMAASLTERYDNNRNELTHEQACMYMARLQALLKDIREEMAGLDESITRVILRQQMTAEYRKLSAQDLENLRTEQRIAEKAQ